MKALDFLKFVKENPIVWLFGIILSLLIAGTVHTCTSHKSVEVIQQVDQSLIRKQVEDSILLIIEAEKLALIDSVNTAAQAQREASNKKITSLESDNKALRGKLGKILVDYYADTTKRTLENCERVVDVQSQVIQNQDTIIQEQTTQIGSYIVTVEGLENKAVILTDQAERTKQLYDICQDNTDRLIRELKKQNTWWRRNEKWIFLGAGVAGTLLILK